MQNAAATADAAVPKSTVTTAGDIIYATGSAAVTRLALGATGTVLKGGASAPSWASIVNADVSNSAAIAYSKLALTGSIVNADMALTYTAYTPSWTSTGTAPAIGNATVVGRYLQIGKFVHCYGAIIFGSSSTFGTGNYYISNPVNVSTSVYTMGQVVLTDSSASAIMLGRIYNVLTGKWYASYGATYGGTETTFGQTAPWTWATGDSIQWNYVYEAA